MNRIEAILTELNESDLLNVVGRLLVENIEHFPETIDDMEPYLEEELLTSSLVGGDDEKVIEQWIHPDEVGLMRALLRQDEGALNNIKSLLEKQDLSINKMATDLGMAYKVAHDLVNRDDLSTTQFGTLLKVADYLNVSIEELYK